MKPTQILKKASFLFIIILAFVLACGDSDSGKSKISSSAAAAKPAKKAVDGAKVYKLNCVVCHGVNGDMGASGAHDLTKSTLPLEERIQVISEGRNTMTPFKNLLSEEKIKAVAEFTMTLKQE